MQLCKIVQQPGPTDTKQSEKLAVKFDRLLELARQMGWVGGGGGRELAQRLCSGWLSDLQGSLGIKTYDSHPGAPSRAKVKKGLIAG